MPTNNKPALDMWSVVHVLAGASLGQAGVSRFTAYFLIFGTEVAEQALRSMFPEAKVFDESPANVVADLVLSLGAYELARGNPILAKGQI